MGQPILRMRNHFCAAMRHRLSILYDSLKRKNGGPCLNRLEGRFRLGLCTRMSKVTPSSFSSQRDLPSPLPLHTPSLKGIDGHFTIVIGKKIYIWVRYRFCAFTVTPNLTVFFEAIFFASGFFLLAAVASSSVGKLHVGRGGDGWS
ncbi:hypothetical protein ARMGADRAFT_753362 [Armillaria gallica]|uniref:Uncharacterized protein n=1 Tax=Armillaria gallica TaxID=47427 RepID=A0A2H3DYH6_ARMGA|nr:hypothetical protein ARMGADRAFT_753362 [Armillaria gallica]